MSITNDQQKRSVGLIKVDFEQARAKHLLFKSRLRSILYGSEINELPVLSQAECSLGKWISGYAMEVYGHIQEMHELETVHTEIHKSANTLVQLYKEGKVEEARKRLAEMESVADRLVELLDVVEAKVKEIPYPESERSQPDVNMKDFNELLRLNEELDRRIKEQAAETLKQKERFELIAKATQDAIWEWDLKVSKVWWNEGFETLFGFKREEIESGIESWQNRIHPEDKQRVLNSIHKVIKEGTDQWSEEYRFLRADGSYACIFDRGYCLYDQDGQPYRMVGSMIDITKRVRAEEAIKSSETRFRDMTDSMPQIIWSTRPDGYHDYYNKQWYDFVGKPEEETIGEGWNPQFHPEDQERAWKVWRHSLETGHPYEIEYRLRYKDNSYKWVLGRALPMRNANGEIVRWFGTCTDIQKQKDSEAALKESEDHFKTFANNIQNLAWMADPQGKTYWYNQRWYDYTGISPEEMQDMEWSREELHHPDHIGRINKFLEQVWSQGQTWELTFPLRGADRKYRWFLARAYAVKDADGNVLRWIGTCTDINEQKQAEAALAEKNKELIKINNDLDNFIYTASHDLRAPVSNLEGLFNTLVSEVELKDDLKQILEMIEASFEKFKITIRDLTEITKAQKEDPEDLEAVRFSDVLDDVQDSIQNEIDTYKPQIASAFEVDRIRFSRKNLRSIIYNLLSNAIKYSAKERSPVVKICTRKESGYTILEIADNGLGISDHNQKKVFQMFKRLHDHVEGTGVGLYIVKRIMDNAGGKIELDSKVGRGTTFKVYFRD